MRKRINRSVRLLSKIYDIAYNIVLKYYRMFKNDIQQTKRFLEEINRAMHYADIQETYLAKIFIFS